MKDLDHNSGRRPWTVATPVLLAMATVLAGGLIVAAVSRSVLPVARSRPARRGQQLGFQGAGYPVADLDGRTSGGGSDEALGAEPRADAAPADLETNAAALKEMMTPPGGDALGGDRDTDPNLNGGHGIRMFAPEEGSVPIEEQDTEDSLIGHDHEDKAAWNRERIARLQAIEDDEREVRDGTSEAAGLGGAALGGVLEGWEGGTASRTLDQGDDGFDGELEEEEEVLGDMAIEDMPGDVLDDESINDPNNTPFLPEHRDLPDDNLSVEELLVATPGEDVLSAGAELGVNEELEMEDLNETDSISRSYEDQREFMDDAMDGNERRRPPGGD